MKTEKEPPKGDKVVGYVRSQTDIKLSRHIIHQRNAVEEYADDNGWDLIGVYHDIIRDKFGNRLELPNLDEALELCLEEDAWLVHVNLGKYRLSDAFNRKRKIFLSKGGREFKLLNEDIIPLLAGSKTTSEKLIPQLPEKEPPLVCEWRKLHKVQHHKVKVFLHSLTETGTRSSFNRKETIARLVTNLKAEGLNAQEISNVLNSIPTVTAFNKEWIAKTVNDYLRKWASKEYKEFWAIYCISKNTKRLFADEREQALKNPVAYRQRMLNKL